MTFSTIISKAGHAVGEYRDKAVSTKMGESTSCLEHAQELLIQHESALSDDISNYLSSTFKNLHERYIKLNHQYESSPKKVHYIELSVLESDAKWFLEEVKRACRRGEKEDSDHSSMGTPVELARTRDLS